MSRRDQPFIPLYAMDFLTDEKLRECNAESVGVYIMLMCVMHKQEQYGTIALRQKDRQHEDIILDFSSKLARHLPFGEEVIGRSLRELISEGVLHLEDEHLVQRRMVRDAEISEKRAAAGKKGSTTTNSKFDAAKQAATPSTDAEKAPAGKPESSERIEEPKKRGRPSKRKSILSAEQQVLFNRFYAAYPKKVDPATAERAWAKIDPTPDEAMTDKIIKAIENAKRYDSRFRERDYIPNPGSWLNAKAYLNEYTQEGGGGSGAYADSGHYGGFTADPSKFKPSRDFKDGN